MHYVMAGLQKPCRLRHAGLASPQTSVGPELTGIYEWTSLKHPSEVSLLLHTIILPTVTRP